MNTSRNNRGNPPAITLAPVGVVGTIPQPTLRTTVAPVTAAAATPVLTDEQMVSNVNAAVQFIGEGGNLNSSLGKTKKSLYA